MKFDKELFKRVLIKTGIVFGSIALLVLLVDKIIMPFYVSAGEVVVPSVKGLPEAEARDILQQNNLTPMTGVQKYDKNIPEGAVIFQKPQAGSVVKEGRRIYLFISSGEATVSVPSLIGRSLRDAKFSLERFGLAIGDTNMVESDSAKGTIIAQEFYEGTQLKRGETIDVTVSAGQREGKIRVPDLMGKSLTEARRILAQNSLTLGRINYQPSTSLLPNTVIEQYPSGNNLVSVGDSVVVFVTRYQDPEYESFPEEN